MTPLELKEARISLGFSQEKLAIELGVRRFTVHRWEAGKHKVPHMADLALKQLKHEHRRREALQRCRANRRKQVESQDSNDRGGSEAFAETKSKPARIIFMARGEMGAQGIEFSSASVALVVPQRKITQKQESIHVRQPSIVPSAEGSDGNNETDG